MGINNKYPRRNGDKDLSKVVNILEKLPFEDFTELHKLFEGYRDKTSTLRITRLLYDALAIARVRQLKALAPVLETGANQTKPQESAKAKLSTTRFRNGVTPARLLKERFPED